MSSVAADPQFLVTVKIARAALATQLPQTTQDNNADQDPQAQAQVPQHNDYRHICSNCNRTFKTLRTLRRHARTVHLGTTCRWGDCGQRFDNDRDMYNHIREHQNREAARNHDTELICHWPGCGTRHPEKHEMLRHLRMHNTAA
ncbi:hypothetical protein M434DRAFT_28393 [Hypoxylon sp. CO27-5]|nr:hypothetical protein M434DRAFT_28393 [Hypoxylon sp. CO27-5]